MGAPGLRTVGSARPWRAAIGAGLACHAGSARYCLCVPGRRSTAGASVMAFPAY